MVLELSGLEYIDTYIDRLKILRCLKLGRKGGFDPIIYGLEEIDLRMNIERGM